MKRIIISGIIFSALTQIVYADNEVITKANDYTQAIQVVNLLANANLSDPGMTPTPIIVRYFNGSDRPCWWNKLEYRQDITIHAGRTQGCVEKVSRIEIEPQLAVDKLNNYGNKFSINVDTTKYSSQVTIVQTTAPTYNPQNGLVVTSGTAQAKIQSQFAE